MRRRWRWGAVLVAIAALIAVPLVATNRPAGSSSLSAAELLERIQRSGDVAYSGYAEATGTLGLPTVSQFSSVADLLGGSSQLRVWWGGAQTWRVDSISSSGETDVQHDATGEWTWNYESNTATRSTITTAPEARLPRADDLVPASLARRLLSQAATDEVSRLPTQRIANQETVGLRLRPSASQSTIDHVDVWALAASGLGVRVVVYARGSSLALLNTSMLDLSTAAPSTDDTSFTPASSVRLRNQDGRDLLAGLNQLGRFRAPPTIGGLNREPTDLRSVGLYGQGVTMLVVVALPPNLALTLTQQLGKAAGITSVSDGVTLGLGPINAMLTPRRSSGACWLLVGTVTPTALAAAATDLQNGIRR